MNSLPKTVTRQRRGCDLNPGPPAPESSTLTTRLPSHPQLSLAVDKRDRQTDRLTDTVLSHRSCRILCKQWLKFGEHYYPVAEKALKITQKLKSAVLVANWHQRRAT